MAIIVKKKPDVHVTESELRRFRDEWVRMGRYYCGTPPSLEEYIRNRKDDGRREFMTQTGD